jgi:hypothetical protein
MTSGRVLEDSSTSSAREPLGLRVDERALTRETRAHGVCQESVVIRDAPASHGLIHTPLCTHRNRWWCSPVSHNPGCCGRSFSFRAGSRPRRHDRSPPRLPRSCHHRPRQSSLLFPHRHRWARRLDRHPYHFSRRTNFSHRTSYPRPPLSAPSALVTHSSLHLRMPVASGTRSARRICRCSNRLVPSCNRSLPDTDHGTPCPQRSSPRHCSQSPRGTPAHRETDTRSPCPWL